MKTGYFNQVIMICITILLLNACSREFSDSTPVEENEVTATNTFQVPTETIRASETIKTKPQNTIQPSTSSTNTKAVPTSTNTLEPYPNPIQNVPYPSNLSNPYPQPLLNTPNTEITSEPYPQPVYNPPNPYPAPGSMQPVGGTPYPSGGNLPPNVTQPVAINPIQTPLVTIENTAQASISVTSTTIVRTTINASDPVSVQLISGNYQMIEFFAFWCPYSRSNAPVINGLEDKYAGRITFIYLDIDNPANKPFMEALGYKYQPHFFLLDREGKIIHEWKGFTVVERFEAVLTPLFP